MHQFYTAADNEKPHTKVVNGMEVKMRSSNQKAAAILMRLMNSLPPAQTKA